VAVDDGERVAGSGSQEGAVHGDDAVRAHECGQETCGLARRLEAGPTLAAFASVDPNATAAASNGSSAGRSEP